MIFVTRAWRDFSRSVWSNWKDRLTAMVVLASVVSALVAVLTYLRLPASGDAPDRPRSDQVSGTTGSR
jgi:hypothetical protein